MVKKCSVLKIIHDKYKKRRGDDPIAELVESFDIALKENKDLVPLVDKTQVSRMLWLLKVLINNKNIMYSFICHFSTLEHIAPNKLTKQRTENEDLVKTS